jgi:beta-lactamase superfamily II metal-dependent hydrolase
MSVFHWRLANLSTAVLTALLLAFSHVPPAAAQPLSWSSEDVYVRIVDVGAGLCTLTVAPGDEVMVYDAGRWDNSFCSDAVREVVPEGGDIDLLVLSHSDADHIGEVETILAQHSVRLILRTGHVRETVT